MYYHYHLYILPLSFHRRKHSMLKKYNAANIDQTSQNLNSPQKKYDSQNSPRKNMSPLINKKNSPEKKTVKNYQNYGFQNNENKNDGNQNNRNIPSEGLYGGDSCLKYEKDELNILINNLNDASR